MKDTSERPSPASSEEDGLMFFMCEPAPLFTRLLAFLMDMSLALMISWFLLSQFLLPEFQPEGMTELSQRIEAYEKQPPGVEPQPMLLEDSPAIVDMMIFSTHVIITVLCVYFVLSFVFMKGSSLGKKTFNLEVMRHQLPADDTGDGPEIYRVVIRSLLQALLTMTHPLLWLTFLYLFFNSERRGLHDLVSGTKVVRKRPLNMDALKGKAV